MLLRAAIDTRRAQVAEQRQQFVDAVSVGDSNAPVFQTELRAAEEALVKAQGQLRRKEGELGVDEYEELQQLAKSEYMRHRMNARALKIKLRDRIQKRKFEMDPVERAYRRLVNGG